MAAEKRIVFHQVDKRIGEQSILKDVTFDVRVGEVVGIIGANGSGKTTILRLAAGLSYPSAGDIIINEKRVQPGLVGNLPGGIGVLIESPTFLDNLTGFDNLYYLSKIRKQINKDDIYQTLKQVGLDPNNKKKVKAYSLGMKQRLGIAQAIMERPDIILFDEPTNALDREGISLFGNIIDECKKRGTSFLFVSHSMEDIQNYCDRVFKIENQTVVSQENIRYYAVMLKKLEDVETVLRMKADARIGERLDGNPVIRIPFEAEKKIHLFFDDLQMDYRILKDE
ncbi:ATP-binding cassette domain-containing protein [Lederbergia sp. NSJ-179]|uniref:ABC transporter ATP-binding protein n=1 Tax=Lederbergia sp. NSJ-179 TaxID=2931402 RepID=UPI001FD4D23E|nr:ATP-binding cassette domain-containing protein [Lederbergia sp. NSJ-179]MCJ7841737.1 ATP-binding cassette domain-containing protein [Lederbergia sp. NSJ-179]